MKFVFSKIIETLLANIDTISHVCYIIIVSMKGGRRNVLLCDGKFLDRLKRLSQIRHWNGRSPVCTAVVKV